MQLNWLRSPGSIVTHPQLWYVILSSCFMHKFIKFLIVYAAESQWYYAETPDGALHQLLALSVQSHWHFSCSSLGARQSASDANKLIIWMMSVRDSIFLLFYLLFLLFFIFCMEICRRPSDDVKLEVLLTSLTRKLLFHGLQLESTSTQSFNWKTGFWCFSFDNNFRTARLQFTIWLKTTST